MDTFKQLHEYLFHNDLNELYQNVFFGMTYAMINSTTICQKDPQEISRAKRMVTGEAVLDCHYAAPENNKKVD